MIKYLIGMKFGLLTCKEKAYSKNGICWLFICDCGNETIKRGYAVTSGESVSCGCHKNRLLKERATKHGKYKTAEYNSWNGAKGRCTNPKNPKYPIYGGRGIKMCERWLNSFESFLEDMGNKPSSDYSIERKDTNGDYSPENCRWATRKDQQRNMRNTKFLEFNGELVPIQKLAEDHGINISTVRARLRSGKTLEQSLKK